MRHILALAIKLVLSYAILWFILGGIYGLSNNEIFRMALALGVLSYLIGDLLILRFTNNMVATIADFGLALLIIWVTTDAYTPVDALFGRVFMATIAITIFEYFFHKYVDRSILHDDPGSRERPKSLRYQTETSEELTDMRRRKDE